MSNAGRGGGAGWVVVIWLRYALFGASAVMVVTALGMILFGRGGVSGAGETPIGEIVSESGKSTSLRGMVSSGPRERPMIALTFDADMTPAMKRAFDQGRVKSWYDAGVVETLREKRVPATMFVTGMWAELYPEITRELAGDSLFEIGNHSYDHAAFRVPCFGLARVGGERAGDGSSRVNEVRRAQDALKKLAGVAPRLFRFPGGCSSLADVALVNDEGLLVVGWDVVSGDAYLRTSAAIRDQILRRARNGSIIAMHLHGPFGTAGNSPLAQALPEVIDTLRARGFVFVTVSDLLQR